MHSGLYLGGVQLPFLSSLRVYLPRESYTDTEFSYLCAKVDAEQDPVSVDVAELADSLRRVGGRLPHLLPTAAGDRVRVLQLGEGEPVLYAPNQIIARSVAGAAELLTGSMEELATLILPEEKWAADLEEATRAALLELPLQTRTSSWGVPFSWFILIFANDRMEVVEANGRILTVRIHVPLTVAADRAEQMLLLLANMAPDLDLFTELQDLSSWLAGFDGEGIVELDYGPVAQRVHPDDSPADVHMGLQCLAEGDLTGAAAAYRRLANRWMPIRQLANAS